MFDDLNTGIKVGIGAALLALLGFGGYVVSKSFQAKPKETISDAAVDFSEPAKKIVRSKGKMQSFDGVTRRPASIHSGAYDSSSPSYAELPRADGAAASPTGNFFTPDNQEIMSIGTPASSDGSSSGRNYDSGNSSKSSTGADSSTSTNAATVMGGFSNPYGYASSGTGTTTTGTSGSGTGSGSGSGSGGGGGTTTTPISPSAGAGSVGGGAFLGSTSGGFKASVSIGVPLSGVTGSTPGNGYKYQVNLSGQQSQ